MCILIVNTGLMTRLLLLTISFFAIPAAFSQYCISGGPTSNADSNVESVTLNGDAGGINYTGCPGVLGVEQATAQSVVLGAGSNYTISIQFGTCGGNYSGAAQVWIDFNQNGVFEAGESIGSWSGIPPTAMSNFNFTVPSGATTGQTRLRVIQQEAGALPLNPCASFTWGSAVDFSVNIQNGIDCSAYTGDNAAQARPVSSYPFTETHSNSICYSNQNPVYSSPDVFYILTNFASLTNLKVSLCGSTFDTFLTIKDSQGNPIAINDDAPNCGPQSEVTISTQGHTSLYLVVEGWNNQTGDYTLNIGQGTLSIDQLSATHFRIYPNPASSTFQIDGVESGILNLINAQGAVVRSLEVNSTEEIDISDLPSGIYMVKLETESGVSVQKMMIE